MPVYKLNDKEPFIGNDTWIAPNAYVIGDVKIGRKCYIGFGAIIRGDFGSIEIDDESIIEDNVVIHCAHSVRIGKRVIVGHSAMIHDTEINDCSLIGMQSMICDNSVIGAWSIVAEKSLVMKKQVVPPEKVFGGSPAREIGAVEKRHRDSLTFGQEAYISLTRQYLNDFKEC